MPIARGIGTEHLGTTPHGVMYTQRARRDADLSGYRTQRAEQPVGSHRRPRGDQPGQHSEKSNLSGKEKTGMAAQDYKARV